MKEKNRLRARIRNCVDTIIEIRPSLVELWGKDIFYTEFKELEEIQENFDEGFGDFSEEDVNNIEKWVQVFFAEIEESIYKLRSVHAKGEVM